MWKENTLQLIKKNKGKIIGMLIGLLFAVFVITIGLLKTIFIAICIGVGYYFGRRADNKQSIIELIERILPNEWK